MPKENLEDTTLSIGKYEGEIMKSKRGGNS